MENLTEKTPAQLDEERFNAEVEKRVAERLESQRLETERLESERLENERREAERIQNERLESERRENERLEEKRLAEHRARMDAIHAKQSKAGILHFVYGDRVFIPKVPSCFIPSLGRRSALEICTDEDAQKFLVEENAIGTVISEIE